MEDAVSHAERAPTWVIHVLRENLSKVRGDTECDVVCDDAVSDFAVRETLSRVLRDHTPGGVEISLLSLITATAESQIRAAVMGWDDAKVVVHHDGREWVTPTIRLLFHERSLLSPSTMPAVVSLDVGYPSGVVCTLRRAARCGNTLTCTKLTVHAVVDGSYTYCPKAAAECARKGFMMLIGGNLLLTDDHRTVIDTSSLAHMSGICSRKVAGIDGVSGVLGLDPNDETAVWSFGYNKFEGDLLTALLAFNDFMRK